MGMGSNSFIPIPVDHEEKCIIEELYKTYKKVKNIIIAMTMIKNTITLF